MLLIYSKSAGWHDGGDHLKIRAHTLVTLDDLIAFSKQSQNVCYIPVAGWPQKPGMFYCRAHPGNDGDGPKDRNENNDKI